MFPALSAPRNPVLVLAGFRFACTRALAGPLLRSPSRTSQNSDRRDQQPFTCRYRDGRQTRDVECNDFTVIAACAGENPVMPRVEVAKMQLFWQKQVFECGRIATRKV